MPRNAGHGLRLYPLPTSKSWEIDMSDPTDGPADPSSSILKISKQFLEPGPSSVEIMECKDIQHPQKSINLSSVANSLLRNPESHHGSLSRHLVLDVHGRKSMLNPSPMRVEMSPAPPSSLTLPHGRSSNLLVTKSAELSTDSTDICIVGHDRGRRLCPTPRSSSTDEEFQHAHSYLQTPPPSSIAGGGTKISQMIQGTSRAVNRSMSKYRTGTRKPAEKPGHGGREGLSHRTIRKRNMEPQNHVFTSPTRHEIPSAFQSPVFSQLQPPAASCAEIGENSHVDASMAFDRMRIAAMSSIICDSPATSGHDELMDTKLSTKDPRRYLLQKHEYAASDKRQEVRRYTTTLLPLEMIPPQEETQKLVQSIRNPHAKLHTPARGIYQYDKYVNKGVFEKGFDANLGSIDMETVQYRLKHLIPDRAAHISGLQLFADIAVGS